MTIFEASFWEDTWNNMNEWGKGNEEWAKGIWNKMNEWGKSNEEWVQGIWDKMNEWGKNNEIALNEFIDSMKQLGKYDENKLKQAWEKSWNKVNEQDTEKFLSRITNETATTIENKIKSSEIKNQEDIQQIIDESMRSTVEKTIKEIMAENMTKIVKQAVREVMDENTTGHYEEPNSSQDMQENMKKVVKQATIEAMNENLTDNYEEATSIYKSSVQQRVFDTNSFEDINNYNNYEVNL